MNTPMRKIYNKLPQIVGICILTATAGCKDNATLSVSEDATSRVSEDAPPRTLRGSFDVYYNVQTSATGSEGTGTTPQKVQAIHFYEEYIAIEYPDSGGRVFPLDKIRRFSWR
jgi:hypothetical protein